MMLYLQTFNDPHASDQHGQPPVHNDVEPEVTMRKEVVVGDKYRLELLIGSGAFSNVYLGTDTTTGDNVAIKMEEGKFNCSFILHELQIYEVVQGGGTYIYFYRESDVYIFYACKSYDCITDARCILTYINLSIC
jgi:serine/threonine protein kinase